MLVFEFVTLGLVGELGAGIIGGDNGGVCDLCFVQKLRLVAGSTYFAGPLLSLSSLYRVLHLQLQSQCVRIVSSFES